VGGHASIWQTLHVVADAILDHDIIFAQTLLDVRIYSEHSLGPSVVLLLVYCLFYSYLIL